jgi:hypothetical protein
MEALTSQYNVLLEKQQQLNNVIPSRLEQLKEILQETKANLENGNCLSVRLCYPLAPHTKLIPTITLDPTNWKESLVILHQKSKSNNFQKELKEYSSAVSKYGKAIEKVIASKHLLVSDVQRTQNFIPHRRSNKIQL